MHASVLINGDTCTNSQSVPINGGYITNSQKWWYASALGRHAYLGLYRALFLNQVLSVFFQRPSRCVC